MTFQAQVRAFHELCGFHIGEFGEVPPLNIRRERARLVWEKSRELIAELLSDDPRTLMTDYDIAPPAGTDGDPLRARTPEPAKIAHETVDLHYVASGASVSGGWDEGPVFELIHQANMHKAYLADREVGDEHGKARKPVNWQSPDASTVLRAYDADVTNAEEAARWLARESRHPLYAGDGWQVLLRDESKVDHASRHAAGLMTTGSSTQDIHNAAGVLREHIRGRR